MAPASFDVVAPVAARSTLNQRISCALYGSLRGAQAASRTVNSVGGAGDDDTQTLQCREGWLHYRLTTPAMISFAGGPTLKSAGPRRCRGGDVRPGEHFHGTQGFRWAHLRSWCRGWSVKKNPRWPPPDRYRPAFWKRGPGVQACLVVDCPAPHVLA